MKIEAILFGIAFWSIFIYFIISNKSVTKKDPPKPKLKPKLNINLVEKLNGFYKPELHDYLHSECYPYITFPLKLDSEVILEPLAYEKLIDIKKGSSEAGFLAYLKVSSFGSNISEVDFKVGNFYPDFTYIDSENSIYLDIEIDEPFSYGDKMPIHYIDYTNGFYFDKNLVRDEFFNKNGWTVIRFSEQQVVDDPISCINLIRNTIKFLNEPELNVDLEIVNLVTIPRWTEIDASKMSTRNNRIFNEDDFSLAYNRSRVNLINKIMQYDDTIAEDLYLKGSIKRVTTQSSNYTKKTEGNRVVKEYDSLGRLVSIARFTKDLEQKSVSKYKYTKQAITVERSDGKKIIHFFNYQGFCFKTNYYDVNKLQSHCLIHIDYSAQKNIQSLEFDEDREWTYKIESNYDDFQLLKSITRIKVEKKNQKKGFHKTAYILDFTFDSNNNLKSKTFTSNDLKVIDRYQYKVLDKHSNPVHYFKKRGENVFEYNNEIEYYS